MGQEQRIETIITLARELNIDHAKVQIITAYNPHHSVTSFLNEVQDKVDIKNPTLSDLLFPGHRFSVMFTTQHQRRDEHVAACRADWWAKSDEIREVLREVGPERGKRLLGAKHHDWQLRHVLRAILQPDWRALHEISMLALEGERCADIIAHEWAFSTKTPQDLRHEDLLTPEDWAAIRVMTEISWDCVRRTRVATKYTITGVDGITRPKKTFGRRRSVLKQRAVGIASRSGWTRDNGLSEEELKEAAQTCWTLIWQATYTTPECALCGVKLSYNREVRVDPASRFETGRRVVPSNISIDAILPRCQGGSYTISNTQWLCVGCNCTKWSLSQEEVQSLIRQFANSTILYGSIFPNHLSVPLIVL